MGESLYEQVIAPGRDREFLAPLPLARASISSAPVASDSEKEAIERAKASTVLILPTVLAPIVSLRKEELA